MDHSSAQKRLAAIRDWPERALKANYRAAQLAKDCGERRVDVRIFFVGKFARNTKHQLRIFRVDEIRRRLKANECLKNICIALGHHDLAHLTRDFDAVVGMTPHAWMRNSSASNSRPPPREVKGTTPVMISGRFS